MNDYLGRIALRSLDLAPTLDPRLPSLFEPVRHAGPRLPVGDVEELAAASAPGEPAVTRPRQASGPTTAPPVAVGEAWTAASSPGEPVVTRPRRAAGSITGPPERRTPPQASTESAESTEHNTPDELVRNPISLRSPDRAPAVAVRATAEDLPILRIPSSPVPPSVPLPTAPAVFRDGVRRDKKLITEHDRTPAQSISRFEAVSPRRQPSVLAPPSARSGLNAQLAPQLSPKIQAGPLPKPPGRSRQDERPIVHVTIGRVEVRATPPPVARQRPQAAAPPVMTLEEYLRLRASESPR